MNIPSQIARLLDAYLDSNLSAEEAEQIREWADASTSNQQLLVEWFLREADLREKSKVANLRDEFCKRSLFDAETAASSVNECAEIIRRSDAISRRHTALVIAMAGLAAMVLIALTLFRTDDPVIAEDANDSSGHELALEFSGENDLRVATLGRTAGCKWSADSPQLRTGQGIDAGTTLELTEGLAKVVFEGGAEIIVQGPASFRTDGPQLCALLFGSLSANVPDRASGFTVRGPASEVIDLGTQFGFTVRRDGSSEVHVFKGEVITQSIDSDGNKIGERMLLRKNEAVLYLHTVEAAKRLAADEAKFVRAIPNSWNRSEFAPLPLDVPPQLWLRAEHGAQTDPDGGVAVWQDLSSHSGGSANDAFQAQDTSRPRLMPSAFNGHAAVRFDGLNDYLTTTPMTTADNQTVVLAFQYAEPVAGQEWRAGQLLNYNGPPSRYLPSLANAGVLQIGETVGSVRPATTLSAKAFAGRKNTGKHTDSGLVMSPVLGHTRPCVAVYVYDHDQQLATLYINGKAVGTSEAWAPVAVTSRKVIGKHGIFEQMYFAGDIAEVLIFDAALDESDVEVLSNELMRHYGI